MRVHRQRAGDRHPLLLAAREAVRVLVDLVGHADAREQRLGLRPGLRRRAAQHLLLGQQTFSSARLVREQVELLEHHPDPAADEVEVVAGHACR